jgi:hypothetical protein
MAGDGSAGPGVDRGVQLVLGDAVLDHAGKAGAGLLHDQAPGRALAHLLEIGAALDRLRGGEQHHPAIAQHVVLVRVLAVPRHAGQRLDHRHQHAEHAVARVMARQPLLLDGAQRHRGGGVAGDHHQPAAGAHQEVDRLGGVVDDVAVAEVAIGRAGMVAQVEERLLRQRLDQRLEHGEAAGAGVEHADHPRPMYSRPRST